MSTQNNKQSFFQKLTPACANLSKRSMMLNSIAAFFAVVSLILIIIALVYIYMDPGNSDEKAKQNRQIAGGLIIATLFTVAIKTLILAWNIMIHKTLGKCIAEGTGNQQASSSSIM